jgi:hypothetical protein
LGAKTDKKFLYLTAGVIIILAGKRLLPSFIEGEAHQI